MWKPRPPSQRSPERNRHRQDYYHNNNDFHRDSRRSTHWEDDQHRQNNSRFDSYSHFGDNLFEQGTFDTNLRRSPFEAINRLKRAYSPERRGESNRRFPPKSPEEANYRENTRNFHNHRNHERNGDNPMVHNNGFKAARRENNFHRPYNRDHNKNWHENDGCWNQHDPANQYLSPHRRRPEEHERKSFQKRQPHEQRNKPKHLPPSLSNPTQGQGFPEDKQILVGDIQKRSNSTSKDRQLSHDLVAVAGKETFHPVFEHLESSLVGVANATNSEFTKKIITIIHEVKANNFRSTGLSLHERFSKLQEESNKQELNLNPTPQINPEIHRRIDISLEELQSKSLHKTVEVAPGSHRLIEDPNDLRHDIERRRKQRLHSEQNGTADTSYGSSDASSSCYTHPYQETREFQSSSRVSRPPFRISTGRLPVRGAYYRGNPNQYHSSLNNFEDTDEIRKPYKGWGNPAARI